MYWPIWWHVLCIIMKGPQTSELFNITSIHTFYIDVHISLRGSCKTRLNDRELMWNDSNNCSDNNKRTSFFSFSLLSFCSSQMQLGSVTVRSMNWNLVAKIDWHHDVPVTVIRWNKRHKKNKIPTLSKGEIKFGMAYLMLLMDTNINVTSRENFSVLCFLLFVSFDSITTVSLFFPFC